MTSYNVGYIVGSLAKASINRKLAKALVRLAPDELTLSEIPIKGLPLYSYDYDTNFPEEARKLKNTIDWASRPHGKNSFSRKPTTVIGTSPGKIGTAIAQQQLRSVLGYCNSPQMNSPEAYIQFTKDLIDDEGGVSDDSTKEFLRKFMKEFHEFLAMVVPCLQSPRS